jgi:hypothetical protein
MLTWPIGLFMTCILSVFRTIAFSHNQDPYRKSRRLYLVRRASLSPHWMSGGWCRQVPTLLRLQRDFLFLGVHGFRFTSLFGMQIFPGGDLPTNCPQTSLCGSRDQGYR